MGNSHHGDWEDGGDRTFLVGRHTEAECRHHETARRQRDKQWLASLGIGWRDALKMIAGENPLSLPEGVRAELRERTLALLPPGAEAGLKKEDAE